MWPRLNSRGIGTTRKYSVVKDFGQALRAASPHLTQAAKPAAPQTPYLPRRQHLRLRERHGPPLRHLAARTPAATIQSTTPARCSRPSNPAQPHSASAGAKLRSLPTVRRRDRNTASTPQPPSDAVTPARPCNSARASRLRTTSTDSAPLQIGQVQHVSVERCPVKPVVARRPLTGAVGKTRSPSIANRFAPCTAPRRPLVRSSAGLPQRNAYRRSSIGSHRIVRPSSGSSYCHGSNSALRKCSAVVVATSSR